MASEKPLPPGVLYHLEHRREEPSFQAQVRETLRHIPPGTKRVLDLGCGTAALAPDLLDRGLRYAGVDLSVEMLEGAKRRLAARNASLARSAAVALPFRPAAFDAVTSLGLFEYLPDPVGALREVRAVLGTGGVAILSVPCRESPYRRCLALAAPLLRLAGRKDPFDLRSGRRIDPGDLEAWAKEAGLQMEASLCIAPAVVPWPLDRWLPGLARWFSARSGPRWGTVRLFVLRAP
jgi:SAM-dependent methyltransferase